MMKRRAAALFMVMILIASMSLPVFAAPSVSVSNATVEPGGEVYFTLNDPPQGNDAWVSLFPYDPSASWWNGNWDEADIQYYYLRNSGNSGSFTVPYEEGQYIIGLFSEDTSGIDRPIATSEVIYTGFNATLSLSTLNPAPGSSLSFSYQNPPQGNDAWISLFPYEPNAAWWTRDWDEADIEYYYLRNLTNNSGSFTVPSEPGQYIVGLFEKDTSGPDLPLVRSEVITVGGSGTSTTASTSTATQNVTLTGEVVEIFNNRNIGGVQSGPTQSTSFTLANDAIITYLNTYHYFNNGTPAGTIALQSSNGTVYGPWETYGTDGQGGVANAEWHAEVYMKLPAGTYTVIDSNSSTWSYNSQSGNAGFAQVRGIYTGPSIMGKVTGTVVAYNGMAPISGMEVTVYYNGFPAGTGVTDYNGAYSIEVLEGYYWIEYYAYGYPIVDYEEIPVYRGGSTNLNVVISSPY